MATFSNITVRSVDAHRVAKLLPASNDAYAAGDLVDFDGTDIAIHGGQADTFAGVVLDGSEAGQIQQIPVATIALVSMKNSGAALVFGDGVSRAAGSNGVDWTFTKNTADAVAWCYENNIASGAFGLFLINIHDLDASGRLMDVTT